jgi:hypothetical protein
MIMSMKNKVWMISERVEKPAAKEETSTLRTRLMRLTALALVPFVVVFTFAGDNAPAADVGDAPVIHIESGPAADFDKAQADSFTGALDRLAKIASSSLTTRDELKAARKELEQVAQGLRHSDAFVVQIASQDQAFIKGLQQTIRERGASKLDTELNSDPHKLSTISGAELFIQRMTNDMKTKREAIRAAAAAIAAKARTAKEQNLRRVRESVKPKSGARKILVSVPILEAAFRWDVALEDYGTDLRNERYGESGEYRTTAPVLASRFVDRLAPVISAQSSSASCYDSAERAYDGCIRGAATECAQACVNACNEACDGNPLVLDKSACKQEFCKPNTVVTFPCESICEAAQLVVCAAKLIGDEADCISTDVENTVVEAFHQIVIQGNAALSDFRRVLFPEGCEEGHRCFGALGMDCGFPLEGLRLKVALCGPPGCLINGGSWEHDECCVQHPQGMACRRGPADAVLGNDGHCVAEWNKAVTLATLGLNWFRKVDFNECNTSGHVVFNEYCALKGSIVRKDDVKYCCSKSASTLDALTPAELSALGPALKEIGDRTEVRVCK